MWSSVVDVEAELTVRIHPAGPERSRGASLQQAGRRTFLITNKPPSRVDLVGETHLEERGLTIGEMAERTGVGRSEIARWERGVSRLEQAQGKSVAPVLDVPPRVP